MSDVRLRRVLVPVRELGQEEVFVALVLGHLTQAKLRTRYRRRGPSSSRTRVPPSH